MPYKSQPVLTIEAIKKMQEYNLLDDMPYMCTWEIGYIWFSMIYPDIKFHNSIIPEAYNQPTFLEYLGFNESIAFEIFYNVRNTGTPTREKLMDAAKNYINSVDSKNTQNWAAVNSLVAKSVMDTMGLIDPVKEEVSKLYEAFQRSPLVFQRYFDENHDKNFENLKLVDFVQELLYRRMQKLMTLNNAALQYLP